MVILTEKQNGYLQSHGRLWAVVAMREFTVLESYIMQ